MRTVTKRHRMGAHIFSIEGLSAVCSFLSGPYVWVILPRFLAPNPLPRFGFESVVFFSLLGSEFDAMTGGGEAMNPRRLPDAARVLAGTQAQSVLLKHIKMRRLSIPRIGGAVFN